MRVATHQPTFLPWVGYYHKILSSDLFVIMDKSQYVDRNYMNRVKLNGSWLTLPLKKAPQKARICDRYPVAGWNAKDGKIYKTLIQYAKSSQCLYPSRVHLIANYLATLPENMSLAEINMVMDGYIIQTVYQIKRKNLLIMPNRVRMPSKVVGDTPTSRLLDIVEKSLPYPTSIDNMIGSAAFNQYYDKREVPEWVDRTFVQVPANSHVITESIIRVLGEIEDPYEYILDAMEWKQVLPEIDKTIK
ncbi:hypothetical protein VH22019_00012 [Vibrio phage VH2_2019]|nr:hypothetical protein VH22019_00012 [Vibrio phage VH2_2019]